MKTLTLKEAKNLIGKKIKWQAPIYEGNYGHYGRGLDGGIMIINDVVDGRNPIKCETIEGVDGEFIFDEFPSVKSDNKPLCFSDGMRYVSFEIIEDEN